MKSMLYQKGVYLLTGWMLVTGCARSIEEVMVTDVSQLENTDPYNEELMTHIGSLPTLTEDLDQLLLPNGSGVLEFLQHNDPDFLANGTRNARVSNEGGPQLKKNLLLARMTTVAHRLCDRSVVYPKGEQPNEPEHYGLAYSYGQRNYRERLTPAKSGCCQMYKIHGLDCSGLLYNILKESGMDPGLPIWADKIRQVTFWEELFSRDADLSKVRIEDLGATSTLQEGDIIYWYGKQTDAAVSHIGVVLKTKDGELGIFQSNGGSPCAACETKFDPNKGCRQVPLTSTAWFGEKWGALRLATDISGKWEVQLKCDWAEDDNVAAIFDIEFTEQDGNNEAISITGIGTGQDYDGTHMDVRFEGVYNAVQNILKGRFYFMSSWDPEERIDELELKLDQDDTGFVRLASIVRDAGSCLGDVRLINKSESGGSRLAPSDVKLTRQNIFAKRP